MKGENVIFPLFNRIDAFLNSSTENIPRRSGNPSKLKSANLGLVSDTNLYSVGIFIRWRLGALKGNEGNETQISEGE
jgi:hypothetical protein